MADLLSIVVYMHRNMICHRDIKLENILFDKNRTNKCVKLFEFGTATKFSNEKPLTETTGTAYCIAPEILSGSYGNKVDEWSLGVLMYIMLTGVPPFEGDSDREILKNVKDGRFSFEIFDELPNPVSEEALDLI